MPFLHGVETITSQKISLVNTIKTAVIGLIGTAESGDINALKICATEKDDIQFGQSGTIPEALTIIRDITRRTGATVMVISIGDGATPPTAADFIGTYDPATGDRTGLRVFDTALPLFGFKPKIFIAPGYSSLDGVIAALISTADNFRGYAYLDAPVGLTPSGAIALRNPDELWATNSTRAKLFYPQLKDNKGILHPFSAFAAANRARVDATPEVEGGGFWVSSSNWPISAVHGLEIPITSSINDITAETNQINAAGIVTCFNNFGADYREWGNRNASFPSDTGPLTFECCQRAKDIIDESIELAMLPFIDKPIIQAFIDNVRNTVNRYFNSLIARGACLEGSQCTYDPAKNPPEELANGHIVFTTSYLSPTPAERITFDTFIDISLLANLQ